MSKTSNVDYQTMRPMLELSAQEVFQIMLGSKVQPADNSDHEEKFDFTSMVGLAGQLCGVVILRCRSESAALTYLKYFRLGGGWSLRLGIKKPSALSM